MKRSEAISKCVNEWKRYTKAMTPDTAGVYNTMENLFNFLEKEIGMMPPEKIRHIKFKIRDGIWEDGVESSYKWDDELEITLD